MPSHFNLMSKSATDPFNLKFLSASLCSMLQFLTQYDCMVSTHTAYALRSFMPNYLRPQDCHCGLLKCMWRHKCILQARMRRLGEVHRKMNCRYVLSVWKLILWKIKISSMTHLQAQQALLSSHLWSTPASRPMFRARDIFMKTTDKTKDAAMADLSQFALKSVSSPSSVHSFTGGTGSHEQSDTLHRILSRRRSETYADDIDEHRQAICDSGRFNRIGC